MWVVGNMAIAFTTLSVKAQYSHHGTFVIEGEFKSRFGTIKGPIGHWNITETSVILYSAFGDMVGAFGNTVSLGTMITRLLESLLANRPVAVAFRMGQSPLYYFNYDADTKTQLFESRFMTTKLRYVSQVMDKKPVVLTLVENGIVDTTFPLDLDGSSVKLQPWDDNNHILHNRCCDFR